MLQKKLTNDISPVPHCIDLLVERQRVGIHYMEAGHRRTLWQEGEFEDKAQHIASAIEITLRLNAHLI